MVAKLASTGSEHTPVGSDYSRRTAPLSTTTTGPVPNPTTGVRKKAYAFGDPLPPRPQAGCDDEPSCSAEMERTAHTLATHQPTNRRRAVLSHQPPGATPLVQTINTMTAPISPPPVVTTPVAHWAVVGVHDDSKLGSAHALTVGYTASRVSSLTHVVPPGLYPQGPYLPSTLTSYANGAHRPDPMWLRKK